MATQIMYRLTEAPTALSGRAVVEEVVEHTLELIYSTDGETWDAVPGQGIAVRIQGPALAVVLAMPHETGEQLQAKAAAYIALVVAELERCAVPQVGAAWSPAQVLAVVEQYLATRGTADAANQFITETLGLSYPVPFGVG